MRRGRWGGRVERERGVEGREERVHRQGWASRRRAGWIGVVRPMLREHAGLSCAVVRKPALSGQGRVTRRRDERCPRASRSLVAPGESGPSSSPSCTELRLPLRCTQLALPSPSLAVPAERGRRCECMLDERRLVIVPRPTAQGLAHRPRLRAPRAPSEQEGEDEDVHINAGGWRAGRGGEASGRVGEERGARRGSASGEDGRASGRLTGEGLGVGRWCCFGWCAVVP